MADNGIPKVGNFEPQKNGGGTEKPKELSKEDVAKLIEALIEKLSKKDEAGGSDKSGGSGGGGKAGDKGDPEETLKLLEKLKNGEKLSPEEMKKLEKATGLKGEDLEKIAGDGKDIK